MRRIDGELDVGCGLEIFQELQAVECLRGQLISQCRIDRSTPTRGDPGEVATPHEGTEPTPEHEAHELAAILL